MKRSEPLNRSVDRAIQLLEYLAQVSEPMDLSAISKNLRMNKSTVYRFLTTLEEGGYIQQDPHTSRYSLGPKVTWLAAKFLEKYEVRNLARPILEELARQSGETVHLAILDNNEVTYVDKVDGYQSVWMASRIGYRMPVHSTALGKVLLSSLGEGEWRRYVLETGLPPRTSNTIVVPDEFVAELERVRSRGYAIDNIENEEGIRCIAAPIRDYLGRTSAALSISGWILTMTEVKVQSLIPLVRKAGLKISRQLGYSGQQGEEACFESIDPAPNTS